MAPALRVRLVTVKIRDTHHFLTVTLLVGLCAVEIVRLFKKASACHSNVRQRRRKYHKSRMPRTVCIAFGVTGTRPHSSRGIVSMIA